MGASLNICSMSLADSPPLSEIGTSSTTALFACWRCPVSNVDSSSRGNVGAFFVATLCLKIYPMPKICLMLLKMKGSQQGKIIYFNVLNSICVSLQMQVTHDILYLCG